MGRRPWGAGLAAAGERAGWRWGTGAALAAGVAAGGYWRGALSLDGALAATAVGGIVFARGGWPAAGALLAFFGGSSALSRIGRRRKQAAPLAQAKGGRRDAWQVLANGGVSTLSLLIGGPSAEAAFLGGLAAAGADTWATELGMLSGSRPRLITTLQAVEAGTSGGITTVGLAASLAGASLVGLAWVGLGGERRGLRLAMAAGTFGSLVDSLLGATAQALYRCPTCAQLSEEPLHERCGRRAELLHGWPWLTNDAVNGVATLAGALAAMVGSTLSARGSTALRP